MTSTSPHKDVKSKRLIAVFSTVTVGLAAGSAIIAPSPVTAIVLILFVVAATLNWSAYAKSRTELQKQAPR